HEHVRQVRQWLADGKVMGPGVKQTRGWDDNKLVTVLQREKEDAHDYRYFPDPDLVPVEVSEDWLDELRATIPQLPLARQQRYVDEYGLTIVQARTLTEERDVCLLYEAVIASGVEAKRAAAVLLNNLAKRANEAGVLISELGITPEQIATIERMAGDNQISSNGADELYGMCCANGEADPAKLAEEHKLIQVSDDSALDEWVAAAIEAEPQAADDVRNGKMAAIGRLIGAVMKASGGQANPKVVQQKIRETLGS
ncbi:MAG: hypothetical protein MI802_22345, partial [Desulfobacterales bacterium]|nr:hypothetical protein [Desulfobacterales bacterium]